MEMQWDDPPQDKRSSSQYAEFAQELKKNPRQWAVLPGLHVVGTTTRIKNGTYAAFRPAGQFDATGRGERHDGNGKTLKYKVWVRFIGPTGESIEDA